MAYETYRVEVTRDETLPEGGVGVEITAYIDRMPETHDYTVGMLTRAPRGVWNSRLAFAGDFSTLDVSGSAGAAWRPRCAAGHPPQCGPAGTHPARECKRQSRYTGGPAFDRGSRPERGTDATGRLNGLDVFIRICPNE